MLGAGEAPKLAPDGWASDGAADGAAGLADGIAGAGAAGLADGVGAGRDSRGALLAMPVRRPNREIFSAIRVR